MDKIFCFCCFFFDSNSTKSKSSLSHTGCCDWKHLSDILTHTQNYFEWRKLSEDWNIAKYFTRITGETSKIVSDIHQAKYFSIISDCTPDISYTEQFSISSSFVNWLKIFFRVCTIVDSTSKGLWDKILNELEEKTIGIQNCRGYDNGAMRKRQWCSKKYLKS